MKRKIFTNPYFFGEERHYLRAQIARISHSTLLTAKGLWRTKEEAKREVEENAPEEGEIPLPATMAMGNPDMWVHMKECVLLNNRCSHPEPPEDVEDAEAWLKAIESADPYDERLKPISQDKKVVVGKNQKI